MPIIYRPNSKEPCVCEPPVDEMVGNVPTTYEPVGTIWECELCTSRWRAVESFKLKVWARISGPRPEKKRIEKKGKMKNEKR